MRIISGHLKGRQFNSPPGHKTHPMGDKVRGALFNALGDISGLTLLDAFAGSGAISLEAVSRGAAKAVAVDSDSSAHMTIKANATSLDVSHKIKAIRANVSSWSDNNPDILFDLVICDPPYDRIRFAIINKLARHVKHSGLLILSCPPGKNLLKLTGLKVISHKKYGDAEVVFYQKDV